MFRAGEIGFLAPHGRRRDGSEVKLLLTTANEHMDATKRARHPHAGCLFVAATAFGTPPPPPLVPLTA